MASNLESGLAGLRDIAADNEDKLGRSTPSALESAAIIDEITRLRSELAESQRYGQARKKQIGHMQGAYNALMAKVMALEGDRKRLDWMLDNPLDSIDRRGSSEFDWIWFEDRDDETYSHMGFESGRKAIDAAMQADGEEREDAG